MVLSGLQRLYTSFERTSVKNVGVTCGLLSVRDFVGIPNLLIHCSRKIVATVTAVFSVGITFVKFEKRPVIMIIYWLPLLVFGTGRSTWIAMSSSGSVAGKKRGLRCRFFVCPSRANDSQFSTIL